MEVVVHDVDKIPSIHEFLDEFSTWASSGMAFSPVISQEIRLILPREEANSFNNCWLNNFLRGENSPGHRIGAISSVGSKFPRFAVQ